MGENETKYNYISTHESCLSAFTRALNQMRETKKVNPLAIKKVIFNNPATIVLWEDGTKTVVMCQKGDKYNKEMGVALCVAKKALGNTSRKLNDVLSYADEKENKKSKAGK